MKAPSKLSLTQCFSGSSARAEVHFIHPCRAREKFEKQASQLHHFSSSGSCNIFENCNINLLSIFVHLKYIYHPQNLKKNIMNLWMQKSICFSVLAMIWYCMCIYCSPTPYCHEYISLSFMGFPNVYQFHVWPTALKLGCAT